MGKIIKMDYCALYVNSIIFYVFGTILFIVCPSIKNTWLSLIVEYNDKNVRLLSLLEYVTRVGFAGFSGFGCSFMVAVAKVLSVFLFLYSNNHKKYFYNSVLILVGSIFYGRIGFVVTLLIELFFTLYMYLKKDKTLVRFNFNIILFITLIGFLVYLFLPESQTYFRWILEPVFNLVEKGSFTSPSASRVGEMYSTFQLDERTLFLGFGLWTYSDGGYFGHVDAGMLRNIYFGGIPYAIVLYSFCVMLICMILNTLKKNQFKPYFMMSLLIGFVYFSFEFKGDISFLFLKMFLPFFLYLYFIYKNNSCFYKNN